MLKIGESNQDTKLFGNEWVGNILGTHGDVLQSRIRDLLEISRVDMTNFKGLGFLSEHFVPLSEPNFSTEAYASQSPTSSEEADLQEKLNKRIKEKGLQRALMELVLESDFELWRPVLRKHLTMLGREESDKIIDFLTNSQNWLQRKLEYLELEKESFMFQLGASTDRDIQDLDTDVQSNSVKVELKWEKKVSKEDLLQTLYNNQFDIQHWIDALSEFVPMLALRLERLELPPIESFGEHFSIFLENITLNCLNLDSKSIECKVLSPEEAEETLDIGLASPSARVINFKLKNIQAEARDVLFAYEKKSGFPKLSDEGVMDLTIPDKGMEIAIVMAVETDPTKLLEQFQNLMGAPVEPTNLCSGEVIENLFPNSSRNSLLQKSEGSCSKSSHSLDFEPTKTDLGCIDLFEEAFTDYAEPYSKGNICLTSQNNIEILSLSDEMEGDWDGDLTSWDTCMKGIQQEASKMSNETVSPGDSGCFRDSASTLNRANESNVVDSAYSVYSEVNTFPYDPYSATPIHEVFRSIDQPFKSTQEVKTTYPEELAYVRQESDATHTILLAEEDTPAHYLTQCTHYHDTEHLLVPSLPDLSPSYKRLPQREESPELASPSLPLDPENLEYEGQNEPALAFDLRALFKIISVQPHIHKVNVSVRNTSRDLLYKVLSPLVNRLAKKRLEAAVRAVIIKCLRDWLTKLLINLVEHGAL